MKIMIRAHDLGVMGEENIAVELARRSIDGVQLVAYKSINGVKYEPGSLGIDRAREIGDRLSAVGSVAMVGAYFNPVHPNSEKRMRGEEMFKEYLLLAKALGADTVGSETGSLMGDPWGWHPDNSSPAAFDRVVSTFRALADFAAEHSLFVGIEGAFNHVMSTPDRLYECISEIDRDNVRVIFDLYNYLDISNYRDAYSILDRGLLLFGGRIHLYHVKDFTVEDGRLRQCGVGRGVLDYERILKRIHETDPDAILVLEGTTGEDIDFAVNHLKSIITLLK